jgi:predicted TIM-barrel fold metal-dependent hydrolase
VLREHVKFTPFPGEDIGRMIRDAGEDLFLFSSDYPHIEGGRNPIGRFETSLGERGEMVRDKFYAENFLRIFPAARAH